MNPESSPFSPGQPVPAEFFVGRTAEIDRLRGMVRGSAEGRFRIGFVSGERGIGKSSIAAFVRRLVEQEGDAVGCHAFLGGAQGLPEMLRRTFDRLLKESIDRPWHEQLKGYFGNRVRQVGLFGVTLELDLSDEEFSTVQHDFVPAIRRLLDKIKDHRRSLFLILDDINGLARSADFANWLKSSVDEIATSEPPTRLCLLVVGLEERRADLIARQPSLARVFDLVDIAPWSNDEAREFYRNSFAVAGAHIAERELGLLVRFTGGLPVLAHEIGDAVWRESRTREIQSGDVVRGVAAAAEVIGRKLLEPRIFKAVRGERCRSILRRIAEEPRTRFTRAELLERLPGKEGKALDSFPRRMKELGAIESDPEVNGGYRFPNRLHALYFYTEAQTHQTRI